MFASILCPIDFSADARAALRYALAVARRSGGAVTALYVRDPFLVNAAAAAYGGRVQFARRTRTELDRFVASATRGARPTRRVATRVVEGDPAREIAAACARGRADLVVIGTHGLGGVGKLFFGSTTATVLERTRVPVLAVPAGRGRRPHAGPREGWPGARVVVPVALDRASRREAERAADVARFFGATAVLVHATRRPQVPPFVGPGFFDHERAAIAGARERLARLATAVPDTAPEVIVAAGDPADVAATAARATRSGLVILALGRRHGLFGAAPGAIAYRVLRRGTTPVLALPHSGRR